MNKRLTSRKHCKVLVLGLAACLSYMVLTAACLRASEGSGSVYPIGVETVLPGMTPPPGVTIFEEFNTNYRANSLVGANGSSALAGFRLSVYAFAPKVVHNWGVHVLKGDLVSAFALPIVTEHLELPSFKGTKTGLGNPELGVAYIAYNHGDWHWWYGLDVYTPSFGYHKGDAINIGQHNFATVPVAAFTCLPYRGRAEVSSRFQYLVNDTDHATSYRSGNEFTWEYVGMINITKKLAIGANGYLYQQTTDDLQNGSISASGNRGRDFAVGPEVRYHLGRVALVAKYQHDTLVQNRPCGDAFWIEFAVPVPHGHPRQEAQRLSRLN